MADNVTDEDIILFLSEFCRIPSEKININSSIQDDLGVDGDDAGDLMREYSQKFRVDLSAFEFKKYFGDEPSILSIFSIHLGIEPIFVRDLIQFARLGYWNKE